MLLILIIALSLSLAGLIAQFASNYHTQVRLIRKFFRNKDDSPNEYINRTSVRANVNYMSVFPNGYLDIYTSDTLPDNQPVLIWIHGGGYVGGDKSCIKPWAYTMAAKLGIAVVSINYCLAPDQHYPSPLLQIDEALDFLNKNAHSMGLDTTRIFLGGDSAGAQLTSQFAALVCNAELQKQMNFSPKISRDSLLGILLCCGFYNMDTVMNSHFPAMKTFLWAYTNEKKISGFVHKNQMSAIRYINPDYCDVYLTCGNADPFIGQAKEMAEILRAANIPREIYLPKPERKKLGHEYQFKVNTPEGNTALHKAMEFIEKRIKTNE